MDRVRAETSRQLSVLPSRVFISDVVIGALASAATRRASTETGGMLLGYRNAREIVILDSIGAGPSAVHAEARFEPDGAWQRERLGEIYRASDGVVTYLGDWHTHPEGWPLPSEQDLATAANVAGHKRARVSQPITLIAGSWPEGMLLRAYLFAESDLVPLQLVEFRPEFFYEARLPGFVSSHSEAFLRPLLDRVRRLGSAREMFQNE